MNAFFERKYIIQGIFIAVAIIIAARLFYLQVIDDSYLLSANNNVLRKMVVYPARGVILDRNGQVLVQNEPVYDLLVTPREVDHIDTALLCELVGIDREGFERRMKTARDYSPYKASQFEKQIPASAVRTRKTRRGRPHADFGPSRFCRTSRRLRYVRSTLCPPVHSRPG